MPSLNRRTLLVTAGSALTVGLAGCPGDDGDETPTETETTTPTETDTATGTETTTPTETGAVRVAHFSPDAPNVDVYVDDSRVLQDVPFGAFSDYLDVPVGSRMVRITAAGDPDTVAFEGAIDVTAAEFTVAAIGELTSEDTDFGPVVLEDDNSDVAGDTARVRLLHASPDAPAVDITVAGAETTLFEDVAFGESGSVEVPAGFYELEVRPAAGGDPVATFPVELTGGTVYTGVAGGYLTPDDEPADVPFDLTLAVDSGTGGGGIVETANVRAAHMSPDAPNVDIYVDDALALDDVPFRAVSDYLTVPVGGRQITITEAGNQSNAVFDGELTLEAMDYTLVAAGELTEETFEVLPLTDDTTDPGSDTARLRAVHVSPDAPTVDITVEAGPVLFDGVPFKTAGSGTVAPGDYTVQIRPDTETNDGQVVYDADVSLAGGTVYTAFASGYLSPADEPAEEAFELTVVQDASY